MVASDGRTHVVRIQCRECLADHALLVRADDLRRWSMGEGYIQDVLSYLSASERELLLSQICGTCFDKLFSPDELDGEDE